MIGKLATEITDALKSQPLVLALLVFNLTFLGLVMYRSTVVEAGYRDQIKTLLEFCVSK